MPVSRLSLTDFRNYTDAVLEAGAGFVLLSGDNGAGKTNILEAVSMLAPGRGLRGAALSEMARQGGPGGFAIAARLDEIDIGTGTLGAAPERRQVRINGAPVSANTLPERLAILWLTPAMDRLFSGPAGDRRRFLDRLVLALEPGHAHHSARFEAAMRARNTLLSDDRWDVDWLAALEAQMAEHAEALSEARARTVELLDCALAAAAEEDFPSSSLALEGWSGGNLAAALGASRARDAAAGRTTVGPHRHDLVVVHRAKHMPAARSSTGEQKALLLGLVLAHAELVAARREEPPILLLDEVAAHLDPGRRAALFRQLEGRGQVWMTATEAALFNGLGGATRLHVEEGKIRPA